MMKRTEKLRTEALEPRNLLAGHGLDNELPPPPAEVGGIPPAELDGSQQELGPEFGAGRPPRPGGPGGPGGQGGPGGPGPDGPPPPPPGDPAIGPPVYSVDGTGNNVGNPDQGSTDEQLLRSTTIEYADGISEAAGADRLSAREVSNAVAAQSESIVNSRHLTDMAWLWGQFVDHDIDLTTNADPAESMPIEVPEGDPHFDPFNTGTATIGFNRSVSDTDTGDSLANPREQINQITAFLDGSVVYGSDQERADALRSFEGGHMATSEGDLLPFNTDGLNNAGGPSDTLFLAGDIRVNENAALSAMQTLWVREHNRLADSISEQNPDLSDEQIYQRARTMVIAQIQAITYNEYLPALLGMDAISDYSGYNPNVDAGISNLFSTSAYRYGHSMLSTEILRVNADGTTADEGNLALRDAFFSPDELIDHGLESILMGAASQEAQEIDTQVVDDVRNFLFGPPGSGGFDLASLNIQRGRDHGLPDYNQARDDMGLERVTSFAEITSDVAMQTTLEELYGDVDNIDVWVGGLAEDHLPGSSVGELIHTVLADQFERIRDGDRLWYQNSLGGEQLAQVENTTLSDVIERNTELGGLRQNLFFSDSVMFQSAAEAQGPADLAVVATSDSINVLAGPEHQMVQSQLTEELSMVMVEGNHAPGGRFMVDVSRGDLPEEGVIVDGGEGPDQTLIIRATGDVDDIEVSNGLVMVNGTPIQYTGIDRVVVQTGPGEDNVQVADDMEVDVVVDPMGPEPGRSPRPGDGERPPVDDGKDRPERPQPGEDDMPPPRPPRPPRGEGNDFNRPPRRRGERPAVGDGEDQPERPQDGEEELPPPQLQAVQISLVQTGEVDDDNAPPPPRPTDGEPGEGDTPSDSEEVDRPVRHRRAHRMAPRRRPPIGEDRPAEESGENLDNPIDELAENNRRRRRGGRAGARDAVFEAIGQEIL
jgi:peroxidase